jgi:hypothetical protein
MGLVIQSTAKAEMERLPGALKRRQTAELKIEKGRAALARMKRAEVDARVRENNRRGGAAMRCEKRQKKSDDHPPQNQTQSASVNVVLTSDDRKKIREGVKAKQQTLMAVLKTVQRELHSDPVVLDENFDRIARLLAAIERENPLIKWNLRLLFHSAAVGETGRSVWDVEFRIQRFRWAEVDRPLERLKELLLKKKRR